MDNTEKKRLSASVITLIITGALILLFLLYFSMMSILAPVRKLDEIRTKYGLQQDSENKADERLYTDSAYMGMIREKSFLQARIGMAETDSVYMTINLADSTANLEISGVVVHSAKISGIKISGILRSGNEYSISSMLASPMNIVSDLATIQKEPLMIKMAPKDTSEFKPDVIPDTSDYEPVNYILEMNNGIRIYFYQDTDTVTSDRNKLFFFDISDRLRTTRISLRSITRLKVPEYHPFIKLRLPKADAKILYRAVPRNGQIAVYR